MAFIGNQKITVIRRDEDDTLPAGRGSDGRYAPTAEIRFEGVDATVDPVDDEELASLPEGERKGTHMWLLTKFEVRTADEQNGVPADFVEYEGDRYEVRAVRRYRKVIPHIEARVRRTIQ